MVELQKPIFCITHPRACSTAFERVFMAREDLTCFHEPFGDAFYYGPERMGVRYEDDKETRQASGFSDSTYGFIFERLAQEKVKGRRVFIKDMAYYLMPPDAKAPQLSPSLFPEQIAGLPRSQDRRRQYPNGDHGAATDGVVKTYNSGSDTSSTDVELPPFPYGTPAEAGNPTVIPRELLSQFHYTFLIRDPHYSMPSYYRCTTPPLNRITGWDKFLPSEAGYGEVRRAFDYLYTAGLLASCAKNDNKNLASFTDRGRIGTRPSSAMSDICVIDADDLLDNPPKVLKIYCQHVGLDYDSTTLRWDDEENQRSVEEAFEKWRGWHDDAINSSELRKRSHQKAAKTEQEFDQEWVQKFGIRGAAFIRECVDANMHTYLYLKQFALQV